MSSCQYGFDIRIAKRDLNTYSAGKVAYYCSDTLKEAGLYIADLRALREHLLNGPCKLVVAFIGIRVVA